MTLRSPTSLRSAARRPPRRAPCRDDAPRYIGTARAGLSSACRASYSSVCFVPREQTSHLYYTVSHVVIVPSNTLAPPIRTSRNIECWIVSQHCERQVDASRRQPHHRAHSVIRFAKVPQPSAFAASPTRRIARLRRPQTHRRVSVLTDRHAALEPLNKLLGRRQPKASAPAWKRIRDARGWRVAKCAIQASWCKVRQ